MNSTSKSPEKTPANELTLNTSAAEPIPFTIPLDRPEPQPQQSPRPTRAGAATRKRVNREKFPWHSIVLATAVASTTPTTPACARALKPCGPCDGCPDYAEASLSERFKRRFWIVYRKNKVFAKDIALEIRAVAL